MQALKEACKIIDVKEIFVRLNAASQSALLLPSRQV